MNLDEDISVFKPPEGTAWKPTTSTPWQKNTKRIQDDSGYLSSNSQADLTNEGSNRSRSNSENFSVSQPTWLLSGSINEIGEEYIDFLKELGGIWRHCPTILTKILSFLSAEDLCSVCCVSKTWNEICANDLQANDRRRKYLASRKVVQFGASNSGYLSDQENKTSRKKKSPKKSTLVQGSIRKPGNNIGNLLEDNSRKQEISFQAPLQPSSSRHDLFQQEASRLTRSNEMLLPCPRCTSPAVIDVRINQGKCSRASCQYLFCSRCMCNTCDKEKCLWKQNGNRTRGKNVIGSKQSKRNLKRL